MTFPNVKIGNAKGKTVSLLIKKHETWIESVRLRILMGVPRLMLASTSLNRTIFSTSFM